ncbi:PKD domain-containing protein [Kribbella sp. NPDC056861]|uniref:PKD domain-containing protein n=1 Tax=Kribbella sp. NPDC056861 TaxID=3154857 RepID=UPI00343BF969
MEQPNLPVATPSMAVAVRIPRPEDVSWDQVLSEVKDVVFPRLGVKVQPTVRTLVNLETIVYTDQSRVSMTTVTLLGFPVVVEATPLSYTWDFGDGVSVTTSTPGRPYPAKDITHKYMKKGGVSLTLTTNYGARFNVAGTGWQYVDGTVPITGPATALQVREAVPVLVEPGR